VLDDNLEEILQVARKGKERNESPDGEDLGVCASRPVPRGSVGIYVFNGREDTRAFQYQHLGFERFSADGTSFVVEFNIPEKWRMTVTGRSLWPIFVNLHQHKIEWIRKADRDFADDRQPIITGIAIDQIKD
jgi:hypothetical protein